MARQLVYTSTPVGLTPGRSGFCTVARHRDLRDRLVSRIESLSSYPADWRPAPVIHAFRWIDLGGDRYAVLSRLVDAGHDYTHRNNFLAHHLILDSDEAARAPRPADIMLQWGGWLNRWDGPPQWFDDRHLVNLLQLPPCPPALPAKTWRELTGDASRAALLVDDRHNAVRTVLRHTAEQEDRLLRLFWESSALVTPGEAWTAEFITCLQPSDQPAEFAWAGVRANSPSDTPRSASIVLDLTDPGLLPEAPDNALAGAAMASPNPPSGMLGTFTTSRRSASAPVERKFTRRPPVEDEPEPSGLRGLVWIGSVAVVTVTLVATAWLLLFRHTDWSSAMTRAFAPNGTVTAPPPPSPSELLNENTGKTLALQRAWSEIEQLTTAGQFFEALDRWRDLENTAPDFATLHVNFLKARLLPAAQQDWSNTLTQIVAKLNDGKADRTELLAQLEAMKTFPHIWPVANPVALENAWKSTAEIFKVLKVLPDAPVWLVDEITVAGAGDGYQELTSTVAIPELQALLATGEMKARIYCAPADSFALPLRGEWFEFEIQPGDHARGDYLILPDSTRGAAGGRFLQLFSEAGGKTRLVWRLFEENTDFFRRAPANELLKNNTGRLWLRVVGEPPLSSFYVLLRRTDLATATPWKSISAPLSWLVAEGAPASVKLPQWLIANLRLMALPGQALRLEPRKGGSAVATSYDNPQAKNATTPATVHYEAAWLMNVLDQQIRTLQTALIQTREQIAKAKDGPPSPNDLQARQAEEKMSQDLAQLQTARTAAATAGWPRDAAPWQLVQLRKPVPPLPLFEFYPDETRPTP